MKRYIKADSVDDSSALADEYVAKYIELFADRGFDMEERPAFGVSRMLSVVSVGGDNSVVCDGGPVFDGYMAQPYDFWVINSNSAYKNLKPIDDDIESRMIKSADQFVDNWLYKYDTLKQQVSEFREIEPVLPSIAEDFKTTYAQQFPGLELNIGIPTTTYDIYPYPVIYGTELRLRFSGTAADKTFSETYTWNTWESGEGEIDLVKILTRIYKSAARNAKSGNGEIVAILKEYGIDTTRAKYELVAEEYVVEEYERHENGRRYKKTFSCPGDYLAYFSMVLHQTPNYNNLKDYFGDITEFEGFVADHPTLDSIADIASSSWWGDGDDYIISLNNLTTGKTLYEGDEEDEWE